MPDLNDRNSYIDFTVTGNDPLTDKLIGKITGIPLLKNYRIQKPNEFRADKIAAKFFEDSGLFWLVLEYNALLSNYELVAGKLIKIPDKRYFNNVILTSGKSVTTSTIYLK